MVSNEEKNEDIEHEIAGKELENEEEFQKEGTSQTKENEESSKDEDNEIIETLDERNEKDQPIDDEESQNKDCNLDDCLLYTSDAADE